MLNFYKITVNSPVASNALPYTNPEMFGTIGIFYIFVKIEAY